MLLSHVSIHTYIHTYTHTHTNCTSSIFIAGIPENEAVLFEIGATSGVLTVSGTLDREVFSRYVVIVKVSGSAKCLLH